MSLLWKRGGRPHACPPSRDTRRVISGVSRLLVGVSGCQTHAARLSDPRRVRQSEQSRFLVARLCDMARLTSAEHLTRELKQVRRCRKLFAFHTVGESRDYSPRNCRRGCTRAFPLDRPRAAGAGRSRRRFAAMVHSSPRAANRRCPHRIGRTLLTATDPAVTAVVEAGGFPFRSVTCCRASTWCALPAWAAHGD